MLAWPAARRAARQLQGAWLSSDLRRQLSRLQAELTRLERQLHKTGLRQHLRPDRAPTAGAVERLVRCALSGPHRRARRDCVAGLRWLVLFHPRRRRLALAAALGLRTQRHTKLYRRASADVRSMLSALRRQYRKQPWRAAVRPDDAATKYAAI